MSESFVETPPSETVYQSFLICQMFGVREGLIGGASFGEKGTFLHGGYYTLFYLLLTSPTSLVILKLKYKTRGAR